MYYYNTSFHIEKNLLAEWLHWAEKFYIPSMLQEIGFLKATILCVMTQEIDFQTYSIQFEAPDSIFIKKFQDEDQARFQHLLYQQFGERVVSFSTELHVFKQIS